MQISLVIIVESPCISCHPIWSEGYPRLLSTKPSAEPPLCLGGLLTHCLVKLVCGSVDLLAGSAILCLSLGLCLLKLLLRIRTICVELLLSFLCFDSGLIRLGMVSTCVDSHLVAAKRE